MYGVILGKNSELSRAEFYSFGRRFGLKVKSIEEEHNWIVFESKPSVERYFRWIGGSLKLVRIVGEGEEALEELEYSRLFTVSLYGKSDWKLWRKLGSEIKKRFKEEGSAKFFKPAKTYAMPAELILKGFPEVKDFVFLFREDGSFLVGETIRVTDPFELKKLDVERPVQKPILSIPPRLARIMVNLTEVRKGSFLDPFCGIGTVVQEFVLQGLTAYGSDRDEGQIRDAKKNLTWLRKEFRLKNSAHLEVCDARKLKKCFRQRFDAIVTEPYLGKPLKRHPSRGEAIKLANELDRFYYSVFESFADVLKRNGKVVFVFPAYKLSGGGIYRKERKWLVKLGFEVLGRYPDYEERHRVVRDIHVLRYRG
ncbi:predicted DNA methylase [Thermococcus kodakarensis KOD1]|uniref:Predicted DNA methylase n=1 Tax=Thermococcus kodakarensis (strain ATCC BAA-918 / JCM 12380 / KOD1) TaxID=69014 RepID=Q5JEC3_THEKO|nr:TRM11 family methyltransferase [Thermococcus kodakarensis]WCN28133.1 TRM11 family methyltransferase [Thermococcus kodakarensis]WCN30430.1 TRM11 family methyltransferase [Thermococcus kodakarensis]BAD84197.1 predicted DNA methylase [Thermococcus kodakarensis KOD1]